MELSRRWEPAESQNDDRQHPAGNHHRSLSTIKFKEPGTYESSDPMDHLSHAISGQSQAAQQQPQLHRRTRASALRIKGRLSRRILRRSSQYRSSSDLRGYLCAVADRPRRDSRECESAQLLHDPRSAGNFAAAQDTATQRNVAAARDSCQFPASADFRPQNRAAISRRPVHPRPALCLTGWEMFTFTRRHPERSRFSGVAKACPERSRRDLPLNRLRASAKLHNHRTAPNLDEVSRRAAVPWKSGASAACPERSRMGRVTCLEKMRALAPNGRRFFHLQTRFWFYECHMNLSCGKRIRQPRIKPVIVEDTTYGVSLLTGTISGSNFAIP
jgi:hypothetical protein